MTSMKGLCIVLLVFFVLVALAISASVENDGFDEVQREDASSDVYNDPYGDGYGGNRVADMAKMAADYEDPYGYGGPGYGGPGAAPPVSTATELTSLEDIDSFIQEDGDTPVIMGYFDSSANKEDLDHFQDLANTEGMKYRFAYTTEKTILESKKYDGCAVMVYPPKNFINEKYERSKHRFPGKSVISLSFLDFLRFKSLPLAGELTAASEARYSALKKPLVTVFTAIDHERNEKNFQYFANRIRKLAKEGESAGVVFNIANIADHKYDMGADYGITNIDTKKTYVGLRNGNMYYQMTETFTVEAMKEFIKSFKAGELVGKEKIMKSEDDLEDSGDDSESAVVALTKENFKEVVEESDKDVLLEFYAPWCGHCKHLKPEYKKAAEFFKNDPGVTIAAMDATAHDVPKGYNVEGYPTLMFLPANNKKRPQPYDGPRDARGIVDYINKNRVTPGPDSEL